MVFISCIPLIHISVGLYFLSGGEGVISENAALPPEFFGWLLFIIGSVLFIFGQTISISVIISGKFIKKRKNYLFSFIVACLACIFFPFGTVLGVFTIILLSKDSIKELYNQSDMVEPVAGGNAPR